MSSYYGSAAYYGASTLIRFQAFGSSEKTNQAWNGVPSDSIKAGNRTYNNCGEYTEIDKDGNKVVKYYDQTDNYWQNHYHLSAAHTFSNNLDMNVTLHYTKGKGYYEDYKADAKMYRYNLTPFVDGDGNTVKRTDRKSVV